MLRHLGLLAVAFSIPAAISAQAFPDTSLSGAQSSSPVDCSDPMMSGSQQCAAQQGGFGTSLSNPQLGAGAQGQYGTTGTPSQNRRLNGTYSDIEQLNQRGLQNQRIPVPPEPLTEFQKFIASTTNQILPIYGASLFNSVPSTFAPLDQTPVPQDYVIGPGDELRIRVWGQINFQSNVQVDRSGDVYLPQIGRVHVQGLSISELDPQLRAAVGRVYHNFDLNVNLGQIRSIQVYLSGQARRPGLYTVSSLSTLVNALFTSGGPSIQGSLRHIILRRGSTVVTDFDLYALLVKGDKSKDVQLESGDVIFIPPVGAQVAITGSVRNPAIYEIRDNDTLADLIADASGLSSLASESRISIERAENHRERHAMEVAYDSAGLATPMMEGDIVRVYSMVPSYRNTIILRGNVANPGRFSWHPGMRVSELIPDKESLITRDYWWHRAQLGLPTPEFEPVPGLSTWHQPYDSQPVTIKPVTPGQLGLSPGQMRQNNALDCYAQPGDQNINNPCYYQQQDSNLNQPYNQQQPLAPGSNSSTLYGQSPYGQNAYGYGQNPYNPYPQQQDPYLNPQDRANSASLAATEAQAGSTRSFPSTPRTEIRAVAPEIDWNYAVIERLDPQTLKNQLIPFDLGKLVLQHDLSQDKELQAGDTVSILSENDIRVPIAQQTKMVRLDGEFEHPGVYTAQPGETLRQLVERAGGLTSNAYLFGSEFTRLSTRAIQQARMDEYVRNLAARISRNNLRVTATVNGAGQVATAQSDERDLLAALRQIRATGRIVLEIKPNDSGLSALPQLALEDGDRFIVPSMPSNVNVVGSVYDQSSFLYTPQRRTGAYLKLAGGPTRDADSQHEFVIRANGEIISRDNTGGLWGNDFANLRLNPGDTIVVPEKTFRPSALKSILDYSTLFSQMALSAAALSTLTH